MVLMKDHSTEIPFLELCEKVQNIIEENGCGNCKEASKDFRKKLSAKRDEKERKNTGT